MVKSIMNLIKVKEKAIQMKSDKIPGKVIMQELGIKNKIQVETWFSCYLKG